MKYAGNLNDLKKALIGKDVATNTFYKNEVGGSFGGKVVSVEREPWAELGDKKSFIVGLNDGKKTLTVDIQYIIDPNYKHGRIKEHN